MRPSIGLCVEGYPRSGNSFLVAAINRWNPELELAHHTHLASTAKLAVRNGVPTVIVIRDPQEAAASACVWDDCLWPDTALKAYIAFYAKLSSLREHFITATFEKCIRNPDKIIAQCNEKFGTAFESFVSTARELNEVKKRLAEHDLKMGREGRNSTLPTADKRQRKSEIYGAIAASLHLKEANEIYRSWVR